ncbi:MAG: competence protein, partial [Pseudomonadota bacterium]
TRENLKDGLAIELAAQRSNAILLIPVFLAFGIGLYFSLFEEPYWVYAVGALAASYRAWHSARRCCNRPSCVAAA